MILENIEKIKQVLTTDARLAAWGLEKYGKAPTIFIGIDENAPPAELDYPVIALGHMDWERGGRSYVGAVSVEISAGIVNEMITDTGSAKTMQGFLDAVELIGLVQDALTESGQFMKIEFSGGAGVVSYYPLFVSYTSASLQVVSSKDTTRK